jgi:hypothetical protein
MQLCEFKVEGGWCVRTDFFKETESRTGTLWNKFKKVQEVYVYGDEDEFGNIS